MPGHSPNPQPPDRQPLRTAAVHRDGTDPACGDRCKGEGQRLTLAPAHSTEPVWQEGESLSSRPASRQMPPSTRPVSRSHPLSTEYHPLPEEETSTETEEATRAMEGSTRWSSSCGVTWATCESQLPAVGGGESDSSPHPSEHTVSCTPVEAGDLQPVALCPLILRLRGQVPCPSHTAAKGRAGQLPLGDPSSPSSCCGSTGPGWVSPRAPRVCPPRSLSSHHSGWRGLGVW